MTNKHLFCLITQNSRKTTNESISSEFIACIVWLCSSRSLAQSSIWIIDEWMYYQAEEDILEPQKYMPGLHNLSQRVPTCREHVFKSCILEPQDDMSQKQLYLLRMLVVTFLLSHVCHILYHSFWLVDVTPTLQLPERTVLISPCCPGNSPRIPSDILHSCLGTTCTGPKWTLLFQPWYGLSFCAPTHNTCTQRDC